MLRDKIVSNALERSSGRRAMTELGIMSWSCSCSRTQ